jgi:hypothetical protein
MDGYMFVTEQDIGNRMLMSSSLKHWESYTGATKMMMLAKCPIILNTGIAS